MQSATVKSYVSAIKAILKADKYEWDEQKVLLSSLTKAYKLTNDVLDCRLPIQKGLLEMILFEPRASVVPQAALSVYIASSCNLPWVLQVNEDQ